MLLLLKLAIRAGDPAFDEVGPLLRLLPPSFVLRRRSVLRLDHWPIDPVSHAFGEGQEFRFGEHGRRQLGSLLSISVKAWAWMSVGMVYPIWQYALTTRSLTH